MTPKQGSFKSFDFPRKILLSVNGAPYPIEYAVRNCRELGGDIKNLYIHAGPKGCKGYKKDYAMAFQPREESVREQATPHPGPGSAARNPRPLGSVWLC